MTDEIREFRDGIFALRTRRFGTVAELMIEALYNFTKSHNQFHDRYDEVGHQRIEIKFSTVMKANEAVISRFNSIDQCKKANLGNRALNSTDMYDYDFDCNIQQVKRLEFDVLYYGLFFADRIAIFKMHSNEIFLVLDTRTSSTKAMKARASSILIVVALIITCRTTSFSGLHTRNCTIS